LSQEKQSDDCNAEAVEQNIYQQLLWSVIQGLPLCPPAKIRFRKPDTFCHQITTIHTQKKYHGDKKKTKFPDPYGRYTNELVNGLIAYRAAGMYMSY